VTKKRQKKRLIEYLPAIYQEPESQRALDFLTNLLIPFDRLLLEGNWAKEDAKTEAAGHKIEDSPLEQKIADLHLLFDPQETPKEFLSWLGSWAALSFQPELSYAKRRKLLSQIISLYQIRGTRRYLEQILAICLNAIPSVIDAAMPMLQVGVHSTVSVDTYLSGGPPHFFKVRLLAPKLKASEIEAEVRLATSIIELGKPAHTLYELDVVSPIMQLGVHSTIGVDTILGPSNV
jgi:phage tail-like protein